MHWLDGLVLAGYSGVVIALGLWAGRKEKGEEDYFLGGRAVHWLAVSISIYATAASALTFIGVPGAAFGGDFKYLQFALGDIVGRALIAYFLISAYYKARVTTVYQLLGTRFGPLSQDAGSIFFIVTRILASAVRLAGCAIAFSVIFSFPLNATIVIIAVIAMVYTIAGGIKAVIWTDVLQFLVFVGGGVLVLFVIWDRLPGGFEQFLEVGRAHDKFKIFHFDVGWNDSGSIWAGSIFGMLLTFAVLGTDQDMVQRMLTTKTVGQSQRALMLTAFLNIPMTLLFLSVGAALFVYYQVTPDPGADNIVAMGRNDYIFPYFIKSALAPGVRGLLMAGLLAASMSSLDSALNALSTTAYVDLYRRHFKPGSGSKDAVRISRNFSVAFGLVLMAVAMVFGRQSDILWFGFKIMGYTYGALLGVFLLAVWTKKRGSDTGNIIAMVTSVLLVVFLTSDLSGGLQSLRAALLSPLGVTKVAWAWSVLIGVTWTFGLGALWKTPRRKA